MVFCVYFVDLRRFFELNFWLSPEEDQEGKKTREFKRCAQQFLGCTHGETDFKRNLTVVCHNFCGGHRVTLKNCPQYIVKHNIDWYTFHLITIIENIYDSFTKIMYSTTLLQAHQKSFSRIVLTFKGIVPWEIHGNQQGTRQHHFELELARNIVSFMTYWVRFTICSFRIH